MTEKELKEWIFSWVKDVNGTPLDSEINDLIHMVDAYLTPRMKRVELEAMRIEPQQQTHEASVYFCHAYNRAVDDIKSKYGDLYILEREENGRDN